MTKDTADADDLFYVLSFGGEVTGRIPAHPSGTCESTEPEVQIISTATSGEGPISQRRQLSRFPSSLPVCNGRWVGLVIAATPVERGTYLSFSNDLSI